MKDRRERQDDCMETRMDVQEKIDALIDKIGGRDMRAVPLPGEHLFCIVYGSALNEDEENCRQLYQNLTRRYKRGNAFQLRFFSNWDEGSAEEALNRIKINYASGFVQNTNICYIPIVFLMEDESVKRLVDFVFRLRSFLDRDGSVKYHIDLYGLINYSKAGVADNWRTVRAPWAGMIHHEVDDLYFLSKDGMALHNIYSKAMDAIEMNIFLKVSVGSRNRTFDMLWDNKYGSIEYAVPFECDWKSMSYWKMDILVCVVCKYVLEMLDWQMERASDLTYTNTVSEKIRSFVEREIESKQLLALSMRLPVPAKEINEIMESGSGGGFFGLFGKKQKEMGITVRQVLEKLYGSADFFRKFADGRTGMDTEKIEAFVEELFGIGTYQDITQQLTGCIRKLLEEERQTEKKYLSAVETHLNEPVFSGARNAAGFLERLFSEVIQQHYMLYVSQEKRKILEMIYAGCTSKAFTERLEWELQRKRDRQSYLNAIIDSNMPQNGRDILEKMKNYTFYDNRMAGLNWGDDVFEVLKQPELRKAIGEIKSNVEEFVKKERDDILDIFRKGIRRLHDDESLGGGSAVTPLYIIKGTSYALKGNRREYLFGNRFFLNLEQKKEDNLISKEFINIKLYSDEAFYPYTLEFFGLNDSINTCGINGMHSEEEDAGDGADW